MAMAVGVSARAVQKWLRWYRERGLEEIGRRCVGDYRRTYRSPLDEAQQKQLVEQARREGFRTLREAAQWCKAVLGVSVREYCFVGGVCDGRWLVP